MKASVMYHSKSGTTKEMAELIASSMREVESIEAKAFSIDDYDSGWLKESSCVIIGTPIYMASLTGALKMWLETEAKTLGLAGKLGGAFATADYVHGGAEIGIQTILDHLMCFGMLIYSGGGSCGRPVIHLGPVAIKGKLEETNENFELYGKRMAQKALEIFG